MIFLLFLLVSLYHLVFIDGMMIKSARPQFLPSLSSGSSSTSSSIGSERDFQFDKSLPRMFNQLDYDILGKAIDGLCPPLLASSVHRQLRSMDFSPLQFQYRDHREFVLDKDSKDVSSISTFSTSTVGGSSVKVSKWKKIWEMFRKGKKAQKLKLRIVPASYDCPSAIRELLQYLRSWKILDRDQKMIVHVDSSKAFDLFAKENEMCLDSDGSLCFDIGISLINERGRERYMDLFATEFLYLKELNVTVYLDIKNFRIGTGFIVNSLADAISKSVNITTLSLKIVNGNLGEHEVETLMTSISGLTQLTSLHLNFQNNKLGRNGPRSIAASIGAMPYLTSFTINLAENEILSKGAGFIAKALKKMVNLNYLSVDLSDNRIGDSGLVPVVFSIGAIKDLQELHLSSATNHICSEAAEWVALAIGELKRLRIVSLNLYNNRIYDAGALEIANAIKLSDSLAVYSLQFGRNEVTRETRKIISKMLMFGSTSNIFDFDDVEVTYEDDEGAGDAN